MNQRSILHTHTHTPANRGIKDPRRLDPRKKNGFEKWRGNRKKQRFQRLFLLEQTFLPFDRSKISRSKIARDEYNLRVKKKKKLLRIVPDIISRVHTGESSRNISPLHVKKKKILWNIFRASLERELFLLERVFFKSVLVVDEKNC